MLKKSVLCAFVLLSTIAAYGGGKEVGNGGTAVVCRNSDGSIRTAELLDFYEARVIRGIDVNLGDATIGWKGKANLEVDRLQKNDPDRYELYLDRVDQFMSEAEMLTGVTLTPIQDVDNIAIPVGCLLEQVAVQREPEFPGDKRYFLNQEIWNALSEDGKAGLVLHEVIYREAIAGGASDSVATRYFNSLLASGRFESISFLDQYDLYMDLDFQTMRLRGPGPLPKLAWIAGSARDDQGIIHAKEMGGTDEQPSTDPQSFLPLEIDSSGDLYAIGGTSPVGFVLRSGQHVNCAASGALLVGFNADGTLRQCQLAAALNLPHVRGGLELNAGDSAAFDDEGNPTSIGFNPPRPLIFQGEPRAITRADLDDPALSAGTLYFLNDETLRVAGQLLKFQKELPVRFYTGDSVNTGYLVEDVTVPFEGKTIVATASWTRPGIPWQTRSYPIQFDPDGKLAAVMLGAPATLKPGSGENCTYPAGTIFHFQRDGSILDEDPAPGWVNPGGC